jgi:hypothetical protein
MKLCFSPLPLQPSLDGRHYADVIFKASAYLLGAVHTLVLLYLDGLESFVSILLLIRMGSVVLRTTAVCSYR